MCHHAILFYGWIIFHYIDILYFLIHSSFNGYLFFFLLLTIMNNVSINTHLQVFVWAYLFISLGCVPRSGIVGSFDNVMFNNLRNWQTVCQNSCSMLPSPRQCMRIPVFPHPAIICVFWLNPSWEVWRVVSLWLWFACGWESFLMLIGHLYILFGEMSVEILCPFFDWIVLLLFSCKNFYILQTQVPYQIRDL